MHGSVELEEIVHPATEGEDRTEEFLLFALNSGRYSHGSGQGTPHPRYDGRVGSALGRQL